MAGHGGSSAGSYLADPTSPIPSHCASIIVTSTVRVKNLLTLQNDRAKGESKEGKGENASEGKGILSVPISRLGTRSPGRGKHRGQMGEHSDECTTSATDDGAMSSE